MFIFPKQCESFLDTFSLISVLGRGWKLCALNLSQIKLGLLQGLSPFEFLMSFLCFLNALKKQA